MPFQYEGKNADVIVTSIQDERTYYYFLKENNLGVWIITCASEAPEMYAGEAREMMNSLFALLEDGGNKVNIEKMDDANGEFKRAYIRANGLDTYVCGWLDYDPDAPDEEQTDVDLKAAGYEFKCPVCGQENTVVEIAKKVKCKTCKVTLRTGNTADHAYP